MAKNFVPVIEPSIVCDALMPCQRGAATKVMVSWRSLMRPLPTLRWCGCMAVAPAASGAWAMCRRASRAGSNMPCSRIRRRRARATSARSCSAARRAFFERDLVVKEATPRCDCQISCAGASHKLPRPASGQVAHRSAPVKTPHVPPTAKCSRRAAWRCNGRLVKALYPDYRRAAPPTRPCPTSASREELRVSSTCRHGTASAPGNYADPANVTRPRVSGMPANTRRLAGVPA